MKLSKNVELKGLSKSKNISIGPTIYFNSKIFTKELRRENEMFEQIKPLILLSYYDPVIYVLEEF